jgi:hypothetical protein
MYWRRAFPVAEARLARSTVGRIWAAVGLKFHQAETVRLFDDPQVVGPDSSTSSGSTFVRHRGRWPCKGTRRAESSRRTVRR